MIILNSPPINITQPRCQVRNQIQQQYPSLGHQLPAYTTHYQQQQQQQQQHQMLTPAASQLQQHQHQQQHQQHQHQHLHQHHAGFSRDNAIHHVTDKHSSLRHQPYPQPTAATTHRDISATPVRLVYIHHCIHCVYIVYTYIYIVQCIHNVYIVHCTYSINKTYLIVCILIVLYIIL